MSGDETAKHDNKQSNNKLAPVAQLDRVSDSDSEGRKFESCRVYQSNRPPQTVVYCFGTFT